MLAAAVFGGLAALSFAVIVAGSMVHEALKRVAAALEGGRRSGRSASGSVVRFPGQEEL